MGSVKAVLGLLFILLVVAITYQVAGRLASSICCMVIAGVIVIAVVVALNGVKI